MHPDKMPDTQNLKHLAQVALRAINFISVTMRQIKYVPEFPYSPTICV